MRRLFVILVLALTVGFGAASLGGAQDAQDQANGGACATPEAGMMATPLASPMASPIASPAIVVDCGTPGAATPAP